MKIPFSKYEGTGNDFILIDGRKISRLNFTESLISRMCHRRFGIGADGVIILNKCPDADFRMLYFNSDGREGTLCGNGARCITAFAKDLGLIKNKAHFLACDGFHESEIVAGSVSLMMQNVEQIELKIKHAYLDTGSPHFVIPVDELSSFDVWTEGRKIRYGKRFREIGTNVDFISKTKNGIRMRVYERGVEDETYSSGTGAVASAIASNCFGWHPKKKVIDVETRGGLLHVSFQRKNGIYTSIKLTGPAKKVFDGVLNF